MLGLADAVDPKQDSHMCRCDEKCHEAVTSRIKGALLPSKHWFCRSWSVLASCAVQHLDGMLVFGCNKEGG